MSQQRQQRQQRRNYDYRCPLCAAIFSSYQPLDRSYLQCSCGATARRVVTPPYISGETVSRALPVQLADPPTT